VHWVEHFFLLDLPDVVEEMVTDEVKKSAYVTEGDNLLVQLFKKMGDLRIYQLPKCSE
jgi:hypothetical protein